MSNIDKIKAEIERRKEFFHERGFGCDNAIEVELESLLSFIDSLQEESVSEDLEEVALEAAVKFEQSPVGENLSKDLAQLFISGALWQMKQEQETIELAEDHALLAGRIQMKEEMMREAVDADVNTYEELPSGKSYVEFVADIPASRFKKRNKVKLIILKDDEKGNS